MNKPYVFFALIISLISTLTHAEEIGCVTTTWKLIGSNNKICIQAFDDPKVQGVSCHISQAKAGGISGALGVAEDPSQFSIACRQIGPIVIKDKLPDEETAFTESTSLFF